ncbi:MAG: M3 family oligoendopeptidase [Alphaproteobacteria bacterium]|nr:M3 family oligoendopeptidase [Alphaproteobacteria bacterium]MDD9919922.1 M3 family oligoendopeptidase [Alphaproteobacteria bacterium]
MAVTDAENVRWNLSDLYQSENDPQLEKDVQSVLRQAADFAENYRGQLQAKLGEALQSLCLLEQLQNKIYAYVMLRSQVETGNEPLKKVMSSVQERLAQAWGTHLVFFEHEITQLSENDYKNLLQTDEVVQHHQPFLDHVRQNAQYLLSEEVESALAKRNPFGVSEWKDFMDEREAELFFEFEGRPIKMEELFSIVGREHDHTRRRQASACLNDGLKAQKHDKFMARALNAVVGKKALEDAERGYEDSMHSRNLDNKVDAATVQALHDAVENVAKPLSVRYYQLKAKWLGLEKLEWADRNAPLPITNTSTMPWVEGVGAVKEAFSSFSPTLRQFVDDIEAKGWIDAPVSKEKRSGAFCAGFAMSGESGQAEPRAYVMLNHTGTARDFATLAHELGHAVHDMLAIPAQNSLMWSPPLAYAETASIFAEMVTFEHLMKKCESDKEKLSLYMEKCNDHINTVVRQISFSYFEQAMHAKRKMGKLTTEEITEMWMDINQRFYGEDGEVFIYKDVDNLWCYISHFLSPFYVYAYAFGELFTQSLYAVKDQFGDDFEEMYLDLLRAGGTKNAVELMKPFGLDPTDPTFWERGIQASFGVWLDEAEKLSEKLNYQA